jgi:BarA-like signal transduction histidine kinase
MEHQVTTALNVVYPQFKARNPTKSYETFHIHLSVLKQKNLPLKKLVTMARLGLPYYKFTILICKHFFSR